MPFSSSSELSALKGIAGLSIIVAEKEELGLEEMIDGFLGGADYVFNISYRTILRSCVLTPIRRIQPRLSV